MRFAVFGVFLSGLGVFGSHPPPPSYAPSFVDTVHDVRNVFFHFLMTWFVFGAMSGSASCLVVSAPSNACFSCSLCISIAVLVVESLLSREGFVSLFEWFSHRRL